ncbi:MAG: multi-sensor hybrid histidine kinase [Verrucomicrobiaceae bacterium]|nr:multi-sensor hybrid histidine kinase [Verrucomicrobiaceae bacterium]
MEAPAPAPATVLIVDDDQGLVRLMEKTVRRAGFATASAHSGEAAIEWLARHPVDLMLLDMKLPGMSGINVISHLDELKRTVPFIVITGEGDERLAVEMMRCGAHDYLIKDARFLELLPTVVSRALTHLDRQKRLEVAERALKKQHAFSASVLEASGAIMLIANAAGLLVQCNQAFENTTCWSSAEICGKPVWELFGSPEEADSTLGMVRKIFAGSDAQEYEGSLMTRNGERRLITWSITTLRDPQGAVEFIVASGLDITENKRLNAAMASRELFFAMLSHELRTPLTPLFALVRDLAADPQRSEDDLAAFSIMRRNLDLEIQLIDDLLDLTRAARGKLELQFKPTDLHLCLSNAVEICRSDIIAKGLDLEMDLAIGFPFVRADAGRLQQVFWNLIKNSVKFTAPPGRIIIKSHCDTAFQRVVEFRDTGIGMDANALDHIFDPFFQVDPARKQRAGGLGLGLAICKSITEVHGGTLTAASAGPGQGTTFRLVLPTIVAPDAPPSAGEPDKQIPKFRHQGLRLLLVEDHDDSRRVLARLLTRRGYQVAAARSLAEARTCCAEGRFDLLITDLGLPDATGHEVLRELNASHGLCGIAMSGFGSAADLAEGKEAGFLEYLVKPVDAEALDAAIQRVLGINHCNPPS